LKLFVCIFIYLIKHVTALPSLCIMRINGQLHELMVVVSFDATVSKQRMENLFA